MLELTTHNILVPRRVGGKYGLTKNNLAMKSFGISTRVKGCREAPEKRKKNKKNKTIDRRE